MTIQSNAQNPIADAVGSIRSKTGVIPVLAVILGTGMGAMAEEMTSSTSFDYKSIPHFPISTVESHVGRLHVGNFHSVPTVMMEGRVHFYEGYSMQQIAFPVRVMRALGAKTLLVMNASGSVNPRISAGSLVLVHDHINLMGGNPLIGPNDEAIGPRFPDMSEPYNRNLINLAENVTTEDRIENVHGGVLVAVTGPCLETAAEYRFFQRIGADIVSMSTVPEVITAVHCGMNVSCISVVTDECLPDCLQPVDISKILGVVKETEPRLAKLVKGLVAKMDLAH